MMQTIAFAAALSLLAAAPSAAPESACYSDGVCPRSPPVFAPLPPPSRPLDPSAQRPRPIRSRVPPPPQFIIEPPPLAQPIAPPPEPPKPPVSYQANINPFGAMEVRSSDGQVMSGSASANQANITAPGGDRITVSRDGAGVNITRNGETVSRGTTDPFGNTTLYNTDGTTTRCITSGPATSCR